MTDWHRLRVEGALFALETDPGPGLTQTEALRRMASYGPNELMADLDASRLVVPDGATGVAALRVDLVVDLVCLSGHIFTEGMARAR